MYKRRRESIGVCKVIIKRMRIDRNSLFSLCDSFLSSLSFWGILGKCLHEESLFIFLVSPDPIYVVMLCPSTPHKKKKKKKKTPPGLLQLYVVALKRNNRVRIDLPPSCFSINQTTKSKSIFSFFFSVLFLWEKN